VTSIAAAGSLLSSVVLFLKAIGPSLRGKWPSLNGAGTSMVGARDAHSTFTWPIGLSVGGRFMTIGMVVKARNPSRQPRGPPGPNASLSGHTTYLSFQIHLL
jgi:hypothetical protein